MIKDNLKKNIRHPESPELEAQKYQSVQVHQQERQRNC